MLMNTVRYSLSFCICIILVVDVFANPEVVTNPVSIKAGVAIMPQQATAPLLSPSNKPNSNATATVSQSQSQLQPPIQPQQKLLSQVQNQPQPQNPYVVELPVNGYDQEERQQSFIKALGMVLVKNTNNPKITELPEIKSAFSRAEIYVRQFNYINRNAASGKSDNQNLFLQINLDSQAIMQLLQRLSKGILVESKPSILVWLAKDKDVVGSKILHEHTSDSEYAGGVMNVFLAKAREIGVAVMTPTLDLEDMNEVRTYDICSLNAGVITKASNRYGAAVIVSGCVKPSLLGSIWSSRWLLLHGTKREQFNFSGSSIEDVFTQALQAIATKVTGKVTQVVGEVSKVILRITNVDGLEQYNEIVRYLHTFKQVKQIDLVNISADEVKLVANIVGGQKGLLTALDAQDRLVLNTDATISSPGIDLDYKWVAPDYEKPQTQTTNTQPLF